MIGEFRCPPFKTTKIAPISIIFLPAFFMSADMKNAGKKIIDMGAIFVVLKGGHLNSPIISDLLIGEEVFDQIETTKIETDNTHGTGCTMAIVQPVP